MPRIDSQAEQKKHTDNGNVMGNCCHLVVVRRTSVYSSGPLIEPTPHYKPKKKSLQVPSVVNMNTQAELQSCSCFILKSKRCSGNNNNNNRKKKKEKEIT